MAEATYSIAGDCLRCGACSILAPGLIEMGERLAVIVRQPGTPAELEAMDAALFNCPALAIRRRAAPRQEAS